MFSCTKQKRPAGRFRLGALKVIKLGERVPGQGSAGNASGLNGSVGSLALTVPLGSPGLWPTLFWNAVPLLFQPATVAWSTLNTLASPPFRIVMKPLVP